MTRLLLLVSLAFSLAATGCSLVGNVIVGSGVTKSEDRPIRDITEIHVGSAGTLTVKISDKESLTVKADDNILPLLKSEVAGGKLTLGLANNTSVQTKTPIDYIVEVKSLDGLHLSGATTAKVTGLDGKTLKVTLSGASKATLQGKVASLSLDASGASKIEAAELACKSARVHLSGASNATVSADDSLDAHADGASTVTYIGEPKVTQKTSGASSVKRR